MTHVLNYCESLYKDTQQLWVVLCPLPEKRLKKTEELVDEGYQEINRGLVKKDYFTIILEWFSPFLHKNMLFS